MSENWLKQDGQDYLNVSVFASDVDACVLVVESILNKDPLLFEKGATLLKGVPYFKGFEDPTVPSVRRRLLRRLIKEDRAELVGRLVQEYADGKAAEGATVSSDMVRFLLIESARVDAQKTFSTLWGKGLIRRSKSIFYELFFSGSLEAARGLKKPTPNEAQEMLLMMGKVHKGQRGYTLPDFMFLMDHMKEELLPNFISSNTFLSAFSGILYGQTDFPAGQVAAMEALEYVEKKLKKKDPQYALPPDLMAQSLSALVLCGGVEGAKKCIQMIEKKVPLTTFFEDLWSHKVKDAKTAGFYGNGQLEKPAPTGVQREPVGVALHSFGNLYVTVSAPDEKQRRFITLRAPSMYKRSASGVIVKVPLMMLALLGQSSESCALLECHGVAMLKAEDVQKNSSAFTKFFCEEYANGGTLMLDKARSFLESYELQKILPAEPRGAKSINRRL